MRQNYSPTEAIELLEISKATFYRYARKLDIKPSKTPFGKLYSEDDIQRIKLCITETIKNKNETSEIEESKKQIQELKQELVSKNESIQDLTLQLGQWQGRAKTFEELNQKLLHTSKVDEKQPILPRFFQFFQK